MPSSSLHWLTTTHIGGIPVTLDASGVMYVPGASLLVVSDLHFEKGSHYGRGGQFIPPYDTRATLKALEATVQKYQPKSILSLGDAFHDTEAEARMNKEDKDRLRVLCDAATWIWVLGNHDPLPPKEFCGTVHHAVEIGGLTFTHEPGELPGWQVAGHLHPCALVAKGGRRVRRSCFVGDGERLIMPAFGAFTGGLNILHEAFTPHLQHPLEIYLKGKTRLYKVPPTSLQTEDQTHQAGRLNWR
ncbi:MAG: ligase-associated DNA damage response endonuclease PdeM [Pseudomonadota bacterium]